MSRTLPRELAVGMTRWLFRQLREMVSIVRGNPHPLGRQDPNRTPLRPVDRGAATDAADTTDSFAVVLSGGGARGAYQVGVLRGLARRLPDARFDIITGVSAGAINALFLASRRGPLIDDLRALSEVWQSLSLKEVVRVDSGSLLRKVLGWGAKLVSGGAPVRPRVRGLMDTAPLRRMLEQLLPENGQGEIAGIMENVARRQPKAVAVTTLDYATGQTVTWVAGRGIEMWERPLRRSVLAPLTIDHALASASLPILFPAVRLGSHWHGDGGIRL